MSGQSDGREMGALTEKQKHRAASRAFTENNLTELAADIVGWRSGRLPGAGSLLHELAGLCSAYTPADDQYQEAEGLIVLAALQAAATPSTHNVELVKLNFPTMLRKMWSGGEVRQWLEEQGDIYRKAPLRRAGAVKPNT